MERNMHELSCVNCKTKMIIRVGEYCEEPKYRLIYCPKCSTPVREILSDKWYSIETVNNSRE